MTRLDRASHLALYTTFHLSRGNRIAHAIFVPIIFFTMACIMAASGAWTVPVAILIFGALATIDLAGAAIVLAFLLACCAGAGAVNRALPAVTVVPIASVIHLAAWYATVVVGHTKLEAPLLWGDVSEDSNAYFRRGLNLGWNLGAPVTRLDSLVQFCIAPLSLVQDVLVLVGMRLSLEEEVVSERGRIRERLARGQTPFGIDRCGVQRPARCAAFLCTSVQHVESSCAIVRGPRGTVAAQGDPMSPDDIPTWRPPPPPPPPSSPHPAQPSPRAPICAQE